ncbi:probable carboxylesterase 2 [Cucurbita moschata]|uniref:Probable carboxylesterase 2 n=1 Tax=Cucurbita moschata TaxID=3662 RepID=A0A6J1HDJ9_CUCMO|nr:probable carboxylesterase 2 [Cucurbita moschata]
MEFGEPETAFELLPLLRVYKNGRIERLIGTDFVPPGTDPLTSVTSKDVTIFPESGVSARLFLPNLTHSTQRLPLVVYFHGGCFCTQSPFTAKYHNYLNALTAEAKVLAVSVNYRKAPEHPIPAAYEDSWAALQWAISHCEGKGPEVWLNKHADFRRLFLAGASAGANIAHNLAMLAGEPDSGENMELVGVALEHPYFWGSARTAKEAEDSMRTRLFERLWGFICPARPENDDPWVNPVAEGAARLAGMGSGRVLVCVAEKDVLRDRGRHYYEALAGSGWLGVAEIVESEDEDHLFHLNDLEGQKAKDLIRRLGAFFNRDMPHSLLR